MQLKVISPISLVATVLLVACSTVPSSSGEFTPEPPLDQASIDATKGAIPDFLEYVWPRPYTTLRLDEYRASLKSTGIENRGIGVALWAHVVDEPNIQISRHITQRSNLFVDGREIDRDTLVVADGLMSADFYDESGHYLYTVRTGPFYLSWAPKLRIGTHEIKFVVESSSGENLEFTWFITITK